MNTRTVVSIELANGNMALIGIHIARLIRTQDMEAWKANPEGFDRWLKAAICDYVNNTNVVIRTIPVVKDSLTAACA